MGRGGGGHGGGGHGGGHSRHGGGFHSSGRSRGSSFSSSRSSFSSGYHHHHYYGRSYYYSYPRRYNSSPVGSIVTAIIVFYFAFAFLSVFFGAMSGFSSHRNIDEDVLETHAQDFYDEKCSGREDCMAFVVGYSVKGDSEAEYIVYGDDAGYIVGDSYEYFFDYYDANYNEDVGIQIGAAIYDYYFDDLDGEGTIEPEQEFDYNCIRDELGWIDSKSYLRDNMEALYLSTGIQMYVYIIDYDELPDVSTGSSTVFSIVAFAVAVIFIIVVFSIITKSIKKSQQRLKELQEKTEVLNKPLNDYGAGGAGGSFSGGSGIGVTPNDPINDGPYVPNSNFGTFGMHNDVGPTSGSYKINGINNASATESFKEYNELGGTSDAGSSASFNEIIDSDDLTFKSAELKDLENKYSELSNKSDKDKASTDKYTSLEKNSDDFKLDEKSLDSEFRLNESEYRSYDIKNDNDWNSSL